MTRNPRPKLPVGTPVPAPAAPVDVPADVPADVQPVPPPVAASEPPAEPPQAFPPANAGPWGGAYSPARTPGPVEQVASPEAQAVVDQLPASAKLASKYYAELEIQNVKAAQELLAGEVATLQRLQKELGGIPGAMEAVRARMASMRAPVAPPPAVRRQPTLAENLALLFGGGVTGDFSAMLKSQQAGLEEERIRQDQISAAKHEAAKSDFIRQGQALGLELEQLQALYRTLLPSVASQERNVAAARAKLEEAKGTEEQLMAEHLGKTSVQDSIRDRQAALEEQRFANAKSLEEIRQAGRRAILESKDPVATMERMVASLMGLGYTKEQAIELANAERVAALRNAAANGQRVQIAMLDYQLRKKVAEEGTWAARQAAAQAKADADALASYRARRIAQTDRSLDLQDQYQKIRQRITPDQAHRMLMSARRLELSYTNLHAALGVAISQATDPALKSELQSQQAKLKRDLDRISNEIRAMQSGYGIPALSMPNGDPGDLLRSMWSDIPLMGGALGQGGLPDADELFLPEDPF